MAFIRRKRSQDGKFVDPELVCRKFHIMYFGTDSLRLVSFLVSEALLFGTGQTFRFEFLKSSPFAGVQTTFGTSSDRVHHARPTGQMRDHVVKTTVFLKNISDFPAMNEVCGRHFKTAPARSTVAVAQLPRDALVEIEVIAVMPAK